MKLKISIIILCWLAIAAGCKKAYLNVSDELAGGLTDIDQVFENPGYTRRWYGNIFMGVPDYSTMIRADWDGGTTGLQNPWTAMTDEINASYGDAANYMIAPRNAANMGFHRWTTLYQLIRQANIFLEKAHPIPASGVDADQLTEDEFKQMKANALFLRAYYHYLLLEQYGAVPIMRQAVPQLGDLDQPRMPVDSVVNFVDAELEQVIPLLPQTPVTDENYRALPTKGVALAVRAKLWVHAASPLLNGEYTEALALKNTDGQQLFPARDAGKWNKAEAALKALIDYAEQGNYSLYKALTNGVPDPEKSVYELFQTYNNEIIWATSNNGWGGMDGDRFERRATPRSEPNGLGSTAVLQELVDDFYMKDGLPIKSSAFLPGSPLYSETGTSPYNGVNVYNMWINREPRFYNTVFFAGRKWHVSNKEIQFYAGTGNDRRGQATPNGYLLYKRFNRRVHKTSPGVASVFRPSIIFRLAEFYLLYAEALNQTTPGNPDVLKYLNLVRERAGLPKLETLNPAIAGNQAMQQAAIQRESRVELATEGQRYFDVRRWMIAEKPIGEGGQAGDFTGMNMDGDKVTFFTRTRFQTRVFERKQYLYPIPFVEMQKSKKLVQNPGW